MREVLRYKKGAPWYFAAPEEVDGVEAGLVGVRRVAAGRPLLAIPATLDNAWTLRRAGFRTPAPILLTYEFPSGTFEAQRTTAAFLTTHPRAFCLSDMGTGKTRATAMAMDWLLDEGVVRRAIVVAPLSTVGPVWGAELLGRFGHHETRLFIKRGASAPYEGTWRIGVLNHHRLAPLLPKLVADKLIDLVIFDELAILRTPRTQMWKAARMLADRARWVWGLTGSPTPNGPVDAWAQTRLVAPSAVKDMPLQRWRLLVEEQVSMYRRVPRHDAPRLVHDLMRPAIRFRRDAIIDLPPLMVSEREVPLTPTQAKAYKDLKTKLVHAYQTGVVTAANAGVLLSKLLQVAAGVVYDDTGREHVLPAVPRMRETIELIEQAAAKVLVLAGYRSVLRQVQAELTEKWETALIDGTVSAGDRTKIIERFQNEDDPLRVLVAHPGTMAHGLTLTAADTLIWYSPPMSRERYEQANARITRPGQRRAQLQVRLIAAPIDRKVFNLLEDKLSFQQQCLKLFEEIEIL